MALIYILRMVKVILKKGYVESICGLFVIEDWHFLVSVTVTSSDGTELAIYF